MRRLGWLAVLAACTPTNYKSTTGSPMLSTSEATAASDDSGIQTVTGGDPTTATSGDAHTTGSHSTDDHTTGGPGPGTESSGTTGDPPGVCGDGILAEDEFCDDGNDDDHDECTKYCRPPRCGDGILHKGEECDDGDDDNTDECTSACKLPVCGDGFTQAGEECDDGNTNEDDACLNNCAAAKCGDGKVQKGVEVCDDYFNDGSYGGCMPGCGALGPHCGNGVTEKSDPIHNPLGFEHCDGNMPYPGVGCTDGCFYDFSQVTQLYCYNTCSWAGQPGCDKADADIFCRLLTGKPSAKAKSYKLSKPTDDGGFPCPDPNQPVQLDGKDPRIPLGTLPDFGVATPVYYQPTKIKSSHGGPDTSTIQAADLECE